ncbi:hypothetical protein BDW68DRAFT_158203 [Aspergillus falconensis]
MWWLPEVKGGPPQEDARNMTLSDSSRLPAGKGNSESWAGHYPIKVLLPWAFLEAIILLGCRDYGHLKGLWHIWVRILYFPLAHDEEVRYKLQPQFQEVWDALKDRAPPGQNQWVPLTRLCDKLIAAGKLPDIPPNEADKWV